MTVYNGLATRMRALR